MMKLLIAGRTATGKDTLRQILETDYNLNFVKSYTTRPKRSDNENTHIFISKEEAANMPENDKVAKTVIGEYEYFATRQQLENADAYIIDPNGIDMLIKNMPDTVFEIMYIRPSDTETQKDMAIGRESNQEQALQIFQSRRDAEDEQFTNFEKQIEEGTFGNPTNCRTLLTAVNNYTEDAIKEAAFGAYKRLCLHRNVAKITDDMVRLGLLLEKDGKIRTVQVHKPDEPPKTVWVPKNLFVLELISDMKGFGHAMTMYLSCPDTMLEKVCQTQTT